jgi:bis(5'-nucleosidyl)-tetraphosphatase
VQQSFTSDEYSAGAVVFHRENQELVFLILHYEEGHWGASKGHIEKGESLEQTALREIREETGLTDIHLIPGFQVKNRYSYQKNGRFSDKSVTFFLAETHSREIKLSGEHVDYAWLPFAEAKARLTFKSEKEVWHSAYDYLLKKYLG